MYHQIITVLYWDESTDKFVFGKTDATSSDTCDLNIVPGDIKRNNLSMECELDVCVSMIVDGTFVMKLESNVPQTYNVSGAPGQIAVDV